MLRRDRQIRRQIHQLADACLFAMSFWVAYVLRENPQVMAWLNLEPFPESASFEKLVWLYFALIPVAPLILESQNFYNRPPMCPRGMIFWPLLKGCLITTTGLALAAYSFHLNVPRAVPTFFGFISFALVYLKEEILRLAFRSRFAQSQYKRRFILAGSKKEINAMCGELDGRKGETVAVVAQFDLGAKPLPELIQMIHEQSPYGVILSAKHT